MVPCYQQVVAFFVKNSCGAAHVGPIAGRNYPVMSHAKAWVGGLWYQFIAMDVEPVDVVQFAELVGGGQVVANLMDNVDGHYYCPSAGLYRTGLPVVYHSSS